MKFSSQKHQYKQMNLTISHLKHRPPNLNENLTSQVTSPRVYKRRIEYT